MELLPFLSLSLILVLSSFIGAADGADGKDLKGISTEASSAKDLHVHEADNSVFEASDSNSTLQESLYFVRKLFLKYGDEFALSKHHLDDMLKSLGLMATHEEDNHTHGQEIAAHGGLSHNHKDHVGNITKRELKSSHVHQTPHDECLGVPDLLKAFDLEENHELTNQDFTLLCPAVIQQLASDNCVSKSSTKCSSEHGSKIAVGKKGSFDLSAIPARVWGFSTMAVFIISLVGLLGVAVIPIMQKVFYNHLLQFLVALAIGALSGDALLHLLPHAIVGSSGHDGPETPESKAREEAAHTATAWKGLMALGGILFFFITERLLTILTAMKHRKKSKKLQKKKHCVKYCDVESDKKEKVSGKLCGRHDSEDNCDKMVMLVHPNKDESHGNENGDGRSALKSFADATHDEFLHQCDEEQNSISHDKMSPLGDEPDLELMGDSSNGMIESQSKSGHSHGGHGHGSVPTSTSAVAWMVILGDGIHNFSDGLAIGASFANSITGGFSTSVAVFCHELPHEIGDFAVLLRAGMSAKQAALYNCLSSFLCFIGMLIGVSIGNIADASFWVFAAVGGMFLYIALVDMLPEMATVDTKKGENPFLHLLLQVMGILLGSSIMLLIALYEHKIKEAFN